MIKRNPDLYNLHVGQVYICSYDGNKYVIESIYEDQIILSTTINRGDLGKRTITDKIEPAVFNEMVEIGIYKFKYDFTEDEQE